MDETKIEKETRELVDFGKLLVKVWDEDFTNEKTVLCLQFFKAGVVSGSFKGIK